MATLLSRSLISALLCVMVIFSAACGTDVIGAGQQSEDDSDESNGSDGY